MNETCKQSQRFIVTGQYRRDEFSHLLCRHSDLFQRVDWPNLFRQSWHVEPLAVVVAQNQKSAVTQEMVNRLIARFPQSPVVLLQGSLVEGEQRTGRRPRGCHHVYWHEFASEFDRVVGCLARGMPSPWHVPPTSREVDRFLNGVDSHRCAGSCHALIHARAESTFFLFRDVLESLGSSAEFMGPAGHGSVSRPIPVPVDEPDVSIFDIDVISPAVLETIADIKSAYGCIAAVSSGFVRFNEYRRALESGVDHILSKPFKLDELRSIVERCQIKKRHTPAAADRRAS